MIERLFFLIFISYFVAIHTSFAAAQDYCTFPSQRVQCGSLTCNTSSGECIPCTLASQCFNPALVCAPTERDSSNRCQMMDFSLLASHRPILVVLSLIVGILTCAVGVIAGTGGGAILTALYQILLGVPLNESVALSQATIAGQSTFNMFLQMRKFHPHYLPPKATRPIINYTLIAFWLPISLAGTAWGNLVGKVVPDWFRIVLLFALLGYALKRLIDRMIAQKLEDEAKKAEVASGLGVMRNRKMILMNSSFDNFSNNGRSNQLRDGDDEDDDEEEENDEQFKKDVVSPLRHRQQYLQQEDDRAKSKNRSGLFRLQDQDDGADDDEEEEYFRRERESRASTKPKAPKHVIDALKQKTRGDAQDVDAALIMISSSHHHDSNTTNRKIPSEFSLAPENNSVELQPTTSSNPQELLVVENHKNQNILHDGGDDEDHDQTKIIDDDDDGDKATANARNNKNNNGEVGILESRNDNDDEEEAETPEAFPQYPPLQLGLIFATFLPLLLVNLVKNRWTTCGGAGYWILTVGVTIYNLALAYVYRGYLQKLNEKISIGEADPELVPFKWNHKTSVYFPIISATAGAAASLLGIGGGMILNFLFLEAGLSPEESSATGGFATFAVSFEALLQFTIQGKVELDYFGVFFLAGLCSTAIGQLVLMPIIRRRGWRFLIVGSLAAIMGGSMISVSIVGVYDTVELVKAGGSIGFGTMCHSPIVHHLN